MNCEFYCPTNKTCRIDRNPCASPTFCRILDIERPAGKEPFVEGLMRRVTSAQATVLKSAIKTLLRKPALTR